MLNESENANQITGYAFYLIMLGVLMKIIQYLKNGSLINELASKNWKDNYESE
jgi:hypothetical protein